MIMRFFIYRKKFKIRALGALLALSLACFPFGIHGETTEEKLQRAQQEKAQTQSKLNETQGKIGNLENSKTALQGMLTGLNDNLIQVSNELSEIEGKLSDKEAEIEKTEDEIDELEDEIKELEKELKVASKEADAQYEVMKKRIRTIYEQGDNAGYTQVLLGVRSISDLLNRAEYVEKANEYDQNLLAKLKEKKKEIREKKARVQKDKEEIEEKKKAQEEERSDIEDLHADAATAQSQVKGLVNQTVTQIHGYSGQIAAAEADAKSYEAQIAAQDENIKQLEIELAKERALAEKSRSMAKKDLSQINIAEGERDLLACLIYCEAGNEPYEGQVAVGAVVMNRCMSGAFPDTITGVIYQSGQFTPVRTGRLAARLVQGANQSCYDAADAAMSGQSPVGDCLFFRTVIPQIKGQIIGGHVFYNP
ncbi:MAG: cell wall hydrolase [Lachnospiraceae bacterium]|nr:cell wall hydrolase [Lachnospiraceae bacterium]